MQRQQRLSLHHHVFTKACISLMHVGLHLAAVWWSRVSKPSFPSSVLAGGPPVTRTRQRDAVPSPVPSPAQRARCLLVLACLCHMGQDTYVPHQLIALTHTLTQTHTYADALKSSGYHFSHCLPTPSVQASPTKSRLPARWTENFGWCSLSLN